MRKQLSFGSAHDAIEMRCRRSEALQGLQILAESLQKNSLRRNHNTVAWGFALLAIAHGVGSEPWVAETLRSLKEQKNEHRRGRIAEIENARTMPSGNH